MNKKLLLIISGGVLGLLVIAIVFVAIFRKPAGNNNANNGNENVTVVRHGPQLSIPGQNNRRVSTGDFITGAYEDLPSATVIYVDSDISIQYDKLNSQFQITLAATDPPSLNSL